MVGIKTLIKNADNSSPSLLMNLKKLLKLPLQEVRERLIQGKVFLELELFGNNHEEVSKILRNCVSILKKSSISFSIHETGEGREQANPDINFWEISEETMMNILDRS